ncbi:hypothetical protein FA13DRAFT_1740693, partial [Coprinellus micaceus]
MAAQFAGRLSMSFRMIDLSTGAKFLPLTPWTPRTRRHSMPAFPIIHKRSTSLKMPPTFMIEHLHHHITIHLPPLSSGEVWQERPATQQTTRPSL